MRRTSRFVNKKDVAKVNTEVDGSLPSPNGRLLLHSADAGPD